MTDLIKTETHGRVRIIRINRPEKKNSLTQVMYDAMADAVKEADADNNIRVLMFAGSGGSFCAGNDMQDFLNMSAEGEGRLSQTAVGRFMVALTRCEKPVLAAVSGPAIGIGSTMLLHCDLVYAGEKTRFQFPFVNLGICAEFASSYLMPKIMGHVRASELLLFGDPFTAVTAREYGLINAVLPDSDVEEHTLKQAHALAERAPKALRVTKRLLLGWDREIVDDAMQLEGDHFIPMLKEGEALEAITAFMQKRKPDFSKFD